MLRVNLLIHVHTVGLRRDLDVFHRTLQALPVHLRVTSFDPAWRPRLVRGLRRATGSIRQKPIYDINLFVEEIVEEWIPLARVNCFVPHQEWFSDETRALVSRMDWIVCKTQFAVQMFQPFTPRTAFTGFTTLDRYDPSVVKDYNACVHVAGSSLQKGTYTINDVWLRHPRWPLLNLHWTEPTARPVQGSNVRCETSFVDDQTLRKIQNRCGIHLCPSEAEGYGHYLVEAMSSAAVVITTDAPPMNELVRPERGVLAGYNRQSPQGAGMNYYVDPARLEEAVEKVLAMSTAGRERLGKNAREWFLENDRLFRQRLWEVLQAMV